MVKFTSLEVSTQLLHQKTVACHICIFCIPSPCALLHHEIGVAEALNVPDADFLCQLDTMNQGFIFGDIIGCCKMNLEHIMQLISSWRSEHHASPRPLFILDPSKCIRQQSSPRGGGSYCVSAQSTRKSAKACDLIVVLGSY